MQTPICTEDVAVALKTDRQQFYVKAASATRSAVKMDIPKPQLRPPIQPPSLLYLMLCGLLKFDLECGDMHAFQDVVQNWQKDPSFMDMLWAAYGRFHSPSHQVGSLFFSALFSISFYSFLQYFLSLSIAGYLCHMQSDRNMQPVLHMQSGVTCGQVYALSVGFRERIFVESHGFRDRSSK